MPVVEYQTVNYFYIKNDWNRLNFQPNTVKGCTRQQTGWHFIPNSRFCDYLNPAQWFDLVTNHETARLLDVECLAQNLIPLTDQLAIQQTTTFVSFNNTIYALCYSDDCNETVAQTNKQQNAHPIHCREGISISATGDVSDKLYLPDYVHYTPPLGTGAQNSVLPGKNYFWDPLTRASKLQELRPGKNSVRFHWSVHDMDKHIIWNLGLGSWTHPLEADSSTNTQVPQYMDMIHYNTYTAQLTPLSYAVADTFRNQYPPDTKTGLYPIGNTQYDLQNALWASQNGFKHPIQNWFIKMVPIFDSNKALLKHEAQICIVKRIRFEVTPRKSAVNMPRIDYMMADNVHMSNDSCLKDPHFAPAIPKLTTLGYHAIPNGRTLDNVPGFPDIHPNVKPTPPPTSDMTDGLKKKKKLAQIMEE